MAASFGSVILTVLIWFLHRINFLVPKDSITPKEKEEHNQQVANIEKT